MDLDSVNRPRIPAAMTFLILLSVLSGCGVATGFGVAAKPSSEFVWLASNTSAAAPEVAPRPASAAVPPASDSETDLRSLSYQDEAELEPQRRKAHDERSNNANTNAEFASLRIGQAVEELTAAKKASIPRQVEHAGDHDFKQKVVSSNETVLVDFYADWCGPCRMLAPVLDELAGETPDAKIVKVNIDRSPKLAKHYGVRSLPTLILFKDGKPVTRRTGLNSKASLKELIAQ